MSNIKRVLSSSVPATLEHRTQAFVETAEGADAYIGDSSNDPVFIGSIHPDPIFSHDSIDNTDSPYGASVDGETTVIIIDAGTDDVVVDLPTAASAEDKKFVFKRIDDVTANTVTINADGTETIDGASSVTLDAQYDVTSIFSDGTSWHIV